MKKQTFPKETFTILDLHDLNTLIKKHFKGGKNYNIPYENELRNDSRHEIDLSEDEDCDEGKNLTLEEIKRDHGYNQLRYILWSLACKGVIPFDNYLIRISW